MCNSFGSLIYDTPVMQRLASASPVLKPALKKVSDYILRYPLRAATLNIEELARLSGSSTAAVNRMAHAIGLCGFTGLRTALVENMMALISPVDHMRKQLERAPCAPFGLQLQTDLIKAQVEELNDINSPATFDFFVGKLSAAQRIYVVGFGGSHWLAAMAADSLIPYCHGTVILSAEGSGDSAAYRVASISNDDVLLALAMPPYHPSTLRISEVARERGATVLALTDSPPSPLAEVAHHSLYTPSQHPVLPAGKAPTLIAIEALVAQVHKRHAMLKPGHDAANVIAFPNTGNDASH